MVSQKAMLLIILTNQHCALKHIMNKKVKKVTCHDLMCQDFSRRTGKNWSNFETNHTFSIFSPLLQSSHHLYYCITVPIILAYIQSSSGLGRRLSLVADIVLSCSIVVIVSHSRVFLITSERTYLFGLCFPFTQRLRD